MVRMLATEEQASRRAAERRGDGQGAPRARSGEVRALPAYGPAAPRPSRTGDRGERDGLAGLPFEPEDDRALARMVGLATLGGIGAWVGLGLWLL